MPLIHKTNKTSRPVKKGRKYKEITAQQYMFSCDPFSCVTVSSIKIIQNPNASVAHQFDILSYQVLSPLPTVAAPSLENFSEDVGSMGMVSMGRQGGQVPFRGWGLGVVQTCL